MISKLYIGIWLGHVVRNPHIKVNDKHSSGAPIIRIIYDDQ